MTYKERFEKKFCKMPLDAMQKYCPFNFKIGIDADEVRRNCSGTDCLRCWNGEPEKDKRERAERRELLKKLDDLAERLLNSGYMTDAQSIYRAMEVFKHDR